MKTDFMTECFLAAHGSCCPSVILAGVRPGGINDKNKISEMYKLLIALETNQPIAETI